MDQQTIPQQTFSGVTGGGELSLYQYFIASPLFAGFKDPNGDDRKLFMDQYTYFSPSLKNFLASTETAELILATGLNYQLDDGQVYQIAVAIRELVSGKIFIKDFPITVSSKLGIDDIKAGEIANKIISQSFDPIIEDIKRIQRSKFPDKISQIQKESRPVGLTQPTARPLPPRLEVKPPYLEVQLPSKQPQGPQSVRPAMPPPRLEVQLPNKPSELRPQPPPPRSVESIRPPQSQPATPKPNLEVQLPSTPQRPQFKMSDLPQTDAQKSLEQELEKVANVIDLRNKPKG